MIQACRDTGMTTPAVVVVDEDDPLLAGYARLDWPRGWLVRVGPRAPLSDLYNRIYAAFPRQDWYGVLADDVVPKTPRWDAGLVAAAGKDGLAAPAGGHHETIAPHFCLGGDLVRATGWLALPGLDRLYIDTVWDEIAKAKGVHRPVPEIVLEHWHFSNGLAPMDGTYKKPNKAQDRAIYEAWKAQCAR